MPNFQYVSDTLSQCIEEAKYLYYHSILVSILTECTYASNHLGVVENDEPAFEPLTKNKEAPDEWNNYKFPRSVSPSINSSEFNLSDVDELQKAVNQPKENGKFRENIPLRRPKSWSKIKRIMRKIKRRLHY
ncbi:MAG: hypothetical protein EOP45_10140 [Sphingobacteriaceae bacterium]|nr:MAG: hypothetical protein EOP45_10140 [Sphingobacteriaceae bacterium]